MSDAERSAEHARRVQRGRRWIGVMAVVVAAFAPLTYVYQKSEADQLIAGLELQAEMAAPEGMTARAHDAPALRRRFAGQRVRVLGANLALAALLCGLWFWARRAPVLALASAIVSVLLVWIAQAAVDRSTLLDGYLIKVPALAIFAAGLRAALAARRAAVVPAKVY